MNQQLPPCWCAIVLRTFKSQIRGNIYFSIDIMKRGVATNQSYTKTMKIIKNHLANSTYPKLAIQRFIVT